MITKSITIFRYQYEPFILPLRISHLVPESYKQKNLAHKPNKSSVMPLLSGFVLILST